MEENNGRTIERPLNGNITIEQLQAENNQLKQYLQQAAKENAQLRQTWALQRADFLFKVIGNNNFNDEFKMKCVEEIEEFLYPTQVPENKGE